MPRNIKMSCLPKIKIMAYFWVVTYNLSLVIQYVSATVNSSGKTTNQCAFSRPNVVWVESTQHTHWAPVDF